MPEKAPMPAGPVRELLRRLPLVDIDRPDFEPGLAPADPVTLFTEWFAAAIAADFLARTPGSRAETLAGRHPAALPPRPWRMDQGTAVVVSRPAGS